MPTPVKQLRTDDYSICYEPDRQTVRCSGSLRLDGLDAYRPIVDLLDEASQQGTTLTLDLSDLEFLNSSGISMLSMFVVGLRKRGDCHLILQGSNRILWQTRSLKNLQRLMPSIELNLSS
ncbi:MAG: hypothetical protein MH825_16960 [Cyanobacteria bacterium]|nr:hypothetical protein [Cyanobacteriota bacterium]